MKSQLLSSKPNGELGKPVQAVFAIASLCVCALAWFAVWQELPRDAGIAHVALAVLLLGAIPGLFQIFTLALKICQGGRVQPELNR